MKAKLVWGAIALLACISLIIQYVLILEDPAFTPFSATVKFFSYFTVLTNLLVAIYLAYQVLKSKTQKIFLDVPGALTAITVFIFIVGLVYNLVLRQIWNPKGLLLFVNEVFHSFMPMVMLVYWFLYEKVRQIRIRTLLSWLIYPTVYLLFTFLHGAFTQYYPYPFLNVVILGYAKVMMNVLVVVTIAVVMTCLLLFIGRWKDKLSH